MQKRSVRASCSTAYCHDHLTRSDGSCQHCRTDGSPKVYFSHAESFGARVVRLQSLTLPHGGFCPTECGENVCFSYWALNKTVGMSSAPSAHRARSAKLRFDERYQKNRERRNTLAPSKISTLAWAFAKSFAGFFIKAESDQPARLFASFSTFFFQTKKKAIVPPCQGIL